MAELESKMETSFPPHTKEELQQIQLSLKTHRRPQSTPSTSEEEEGPTQKRVKGQSRDQVGPSPPPS